ncbi:hypothetical protein CERZMDRAFT_87852 [Cercospora zeae-maydis SCOH1-5]|uniref:Uncharacterized protein n=1 Tax=Cercospora zeae-maydis SCOH1-5 TaxID=717836 RepID=A0A6A6F6R1_9PEZI|nr:hypothetical protein CERZMDRAFT_87852 [Cercospora zeae-maydis SCOH1-5]
MLREWRSVVARRHKLGHKQLVDRKGEKEEHTYPCNPTPLCSVETSSFRAACTPNSNNVICSDSRSTNTELSVILLRLSLLRQGSLPASISPILETEPECSFIDFIAAPVRQSTKQKEVPPSSSVIDFETLVHKNAKEKEAPTSGNAPAPLSPLRQTLCESSSPAPLPAAAPSDPKVDNDG